MKDIKLIYGSDTGKTEYVINTYLISALEKKFNVEVINILNVSDDDWKSCDNYIIGVSTWWDGDLQSDWESYYDIFSNISFKNKKVAIFGLGDQIGYDEWYCDGLGILGSIVIENGGVLLGFTTKDSSYEFDTSKCIKQGDEMWGLALDEDNQQELTESRVINWVNQISNEF